MIKLRLTGQQHRELFTHLFPGDGKEAIAFVLCGRAVRNDEQIFCGRHVFLVPHELCVRNAEGITWPGAFLGAQLGLAYRDNLAVVKIHSHPGDYPKFSETDDLSDTHTYGAITSWMARDDAHLSGIMLSDGRLLIRHMDIAQEIPAAVTVAGDDLAFWRQADEEDNAEPDAAFEAHQQLFGEGTTSRLRQLRIGIVGCSGTGSVTAQLLFRLGVGSLVFVDDQPIEQRNLNRIFNSRRRDIGRQKVDVISDAITAADLGTVPSPISKNLYTAEAVRAISGCDVVFGCMDSAEGRHLLNRIATFYNIPYFDMGVHLKADGRGGIDEASGVVHYVQPDESTLLDRKAYSMRMVEAEGLKRTNPDEYAAQLKAGYIEGVPVNSPAVASINAFAASLAVNEFLSRLHPYRSCRNDDGAIVRFNFMEVLTVREREPGRPSKNQNVGRGDVSPLLDMPSLS
jgi:hypothetical protein